MYSKHLEELLLKKVNHILKINLCNYFQNGATKNIKNSPEE